MFLAINLVSFVAFLEVLKSLFFRPAASVETWIVFVARKPINPSPDVFDFALFRLPHGFAPAFVSSFLQFAHSAGSADKSIGVLLTLKPMTCPIFISLAAWTRQAGVSFPGQ
jgi:hypothetical protein